MNTFVLLSNLFDQLVTIYRRATNKSTSLIIITLIAITNITEKLSITLHVSITLLITIQILKITFNIDKFFDESCIFLQHAPCFTF